MSIDVVIPFGGDCFYRSANLSWVRSRWETAGFDVVVGTMDGPWSKAVAVADALERSTADTIVVTDCDVWTDEGPEAAVRVDEGELNWVVPYDFVRRMRPEPTSKVLSGGKPGGPLMRSQYRATDGGGILVLRRDVYDRVPLDPRFVGCAQEDDSWGMALRRLGGPRGRGHSPLWHLWHPVPERPMKDPDCRAARELRGRYIKASRNASDMENLLAEIR